MVSQQRSKSKSIKRAKVDGGKNGTLLSNEKNNDKKKWMFHRLTSKRYWRRNTWIWDDFWRDVLSRRRLAPRFLLFSPSGSLQMKGSGVTPVAGHLNSNRKNREDGGKKKKAVAGGEKQPNKKKKERRKNLKNGKWVSNKRLETLKLSRNQI